MDPVWISAFSTGVLAILTGLYLRETRKMRLESVRPSFCLRTGLYTIGGGMHQLFLRNMGGVARDVKVDVVTHEGTGKFFVPSLYPNQEINLGLDFQKIRNSEGFVKIHVKFKDSYGRDLTDSLSVDFRQLSDERRVITFQLSPLEEKLDDIVRELRDLKSKVA
jgi:hypothetical protein